MELQITAEREINTSAAKVWKVIGHDFGDIGHWASIIVDSRALTGRDGPGGCGMVGRVCRAQGFGETEEQLVHYDDEAMSFSYRATKGLPFFIRHAENNWSVDAVADNRSRVAARASVVVNAFPGALLAPVFKFVMTRKGAQMLEELEYYIEHGRPHPRKKIVGQ